MELTQSDYTRPGGKHIAIRIDGKTVVFVEQNMNIDNPNVWDAPTEVVRERHRDIGSHEDSSVRALPAR